MGRVEESAPRTRLGEDLGPLAAAVDRDGVIAAYLIGSQATGRAGPLSDVDVAVWTDSKADPAGVRDLRLMLAGAVSDVVGSGEVDIVVLDSAPALLRHRALRDGRLLVSRDDRARIRLETRAILDYLDTAPLRETLARSRRRRIEEGGFGRR